MKKAFLPEWTEEERQKLIKFLLLYIEGKLWVMHKDMYFWESCGKFIQEFTQTVYCQSGKYIYKFSSSWPCQQLSVFFILPQINTGDLEELACKTIKCPFG